MYSMTAYSCATSEGDFGRLVWECRSVNHRYLELAFRMPEAFHALENKLREIARVLSRGKIECFLTFKPSTHLKNNHLSLDVDRVKYLMNLAQKVPEWTKYPITFNVMELLNRPDIWIKEDIETTSLEKSVLTLFSEAMTTLLDGRRKEGSLLKHEIQKRVGEMKVLVASIQKQIPNILIEQRKKWAVRFEEIQLMPDPHRLEQEMIYFAQKVDVAEEVDRLFIHLNEIQAILNTALEPCGRRLDFLMQELNREVNTVGSKTTDSDVTKIVVDLKVLIEQVREQAQNIV